MQRVARAQKIQSTEVYSVAGKGLPFPASVQFFFAFLSVLSKIDKQYEKIDGCVKFASGLEMMD